MRVPTYGRLIAHNFYPSMQQEAAVFAARLLFGEEGSFHVHKEGRLAFLETEGTPYVLVTQLEDYQGGERDLSPVLKTLIPNAQGRYRIGSNWEYRSNRPLAEEYFA